MKKLILLCFIGLFASSCAKRQEAPCITQKMVAPTYKPVQKEVAQKSKPKSANPSTIRICLDPGHGGEAHGAKLIIAPEIKEKMLNLKTAQLVDEFLTMWGYKTIKTRSRDIDVPLLDRVAIAKKEKCDLFISIHYNSTPQPTKAHGVDVYYFCKVKDARSIDSKALARCIYNRMPPNCRGARRGVKSGDLAVIRETTMPAVLVEAGFLSNPEEAKKIKNPHYLRFIGWSIAKGISDFVEKKQSK